MTLASLDRLELGDAQVEFVLVDNNSSDNSIELLREFAKGRSATVLTERRQGKSFALNSAIEVARGEFLVFADDDILPAPHWITAYLATATAHPEINVFSGAVRPHWIAPPGEWGDRLAEQGEAFGCTEKSRPAGPVEAFAVKGANFMARRSSVGDKRFDVGALNFGAGQGATGGEDTDFARKLSSPENPVYFVPDAVVAHVIKPHECTIQGMFNRQFRIGRSHAASHGENLRTLPKLIVQVVLYAGSTLAGLATFRRAAAARNFLKLSFCYGRMRVVLSRRSH